MKPGQNSIRIEVLLGELKEVQRLEPDNVAALCRIGSRLSQLGDTRGGGRSYRAAVEALHRAAKRGDVQRSLEFEEAIYNTFVKAVETEEHYRECFADWSNALDSLGRRHRAAEPASRDAGCRMAFFLHAGAVLGHTEVLLKTLESRPSSGERGEVAGIYVLTLCEPAFLARCRALGVEVFTATEALGPASSYQARFAWLKERLAADRANVCVWVSVPTMAAFALATRLAPVQIFWALRFHPISSPDIDGYITWGAPDEKVRRYGDREWRVVPMQLALDGSQPGRADVEAVRSRFPHPLLLGTLAREEKINSEPFLRSVVKILAAHPQAGFIWTGRTEHAGITARLRAAGVESRCHFAGWVDTRLYAAALDVFLETFPVGSGITSLHAFAAGRPLLSYLDPETIFGTYYWHAVSARSAAAGGGPVLASADEFPILCARDEPEYVELASRLVSDPALRTAVGERGRAFFRAELDNNRRYAERFFTAVVEIAAAGA